MSVNQVNQTTGALSPIAGGTLYADAPVGSIQAYGGATAPWGWLLCQGQAVSRATYAELFGVIGTSFGAGDGSTTFNVPDLRESTVKGAGLTGKSSNHLDADGLALGEFIDDRIQSHTHTYTNVHNGTNPNYGRADFTGSASEKYNFDSFTLTSSAPTGRSGTTTEVKAVGVNFIIKATTIALPSDFETAVDEKIAKDGVYSTEEVKTNKTWIDGKPIYRKVIVLTSNIASGGTIPISSNIDMLVDFGGTGYFGASRYYRQFPWIASDYQGVINGYTSSSAYYFSNTQTGVLGSGSKIWFEYTKTTD